MVFAVPGERTLRWFGIDFSTTREDYASSLIENGQELDGGICYYPTNG